MFRVGQKVVLVDDSGWEDLDRTRWHFPVKGVVYTVRDMIAGHAPCGSIRLNELTNQRGFNFELGLYDEPFFRASRFRPAVERNTDISFAHEILRKLNKKQPTKVH